jgi:hypothetical protein
LATELAERASSVVEAVALDIPSRGIWKEEQTNAENESKEPLHGHGNAVRAGVHAILSGIVYYGS